MDLHKIDNPSRTRGDVVASTDDNSIGGVAANGTKDFLLVPDNDDKKMLRTTSAQVVQVIQWTKKSRYRSHKEGVVLVRIKYPDY